MEEILPMIARTFGLGYNPLSISPLTLRVTAFKIGIMNLLISSIPKRFRNPLTRASRFMELKHVEG